MNNAKQTLSSSFASRMLMNKKLLLLPLLSILFLPNAFAMCPLCTAGAAVAAGGAVWLGVKAQVIGIFIGAFAISTGWWTSKLVKKQYVPYQRLLLILILFLATVIPFIPFMTPLYPMYISIAGDYGSLLNRTYAVNLFLAGSIVGGIITSLTPWLSDKITKLRRKQIPFQGISLTFILLMVIGTIIQLVM